MTNQTGIELLPADLLSTLRGMSNRTLWPMIKGLGGIPREQITARGATHFTAMGKDSLIDAFVATYGVEAVREAVSKAGTEPKQPKAPKAPRSEDDAQLLADVLRRMAGQTIDADQVRAIVADQLEEQISQLGLVRRIVVERNDAPTIDVGVQHKRFEHLLKMLACRLPNGRRLNVWLHGPAGTGKTSAARKVADALNLKFFFTGAIETAYALYGYTDAHGRTVRTPFRDAWEHGGVFLMDEADASHPQALAALNAAIDGSVAAFPDGMIERHADCVIVAGANTVGRGGDSRYAGRVRQDEAFLSRWVLLEWELDETLESYLAGNDDAAKTMLIEVRKLRVRATERRIDGASLTTRAILDGAALLRGGLPLDVVLEGVVRKGMPKDSWSRLTQD